MTGAMDTKKQLVNSYNMKQMSSETKPQAKAAIYPIPRSTSVKKIDIIKSLPHEPVKGAVLPMTATTSSVNPVSDTLRNSVQQSSVPYSRTSARDSQDRRVNVGLSDRTSDLNLSASAEINAAAATLCNLTQNASLQKVLNPDMTIPTSKSVTSGDLSAEVNSLKEQLEVQSKVNSDLKKLLVASIGDDLHYKVDALVRTKVQLANEIDDYTRKLVEDYEDLDKISIQADLWHSKYQACRVLADQLTLERDKLNVLCTQATASLQQLITERQHLQQQQRYLNRGLLSLHNMFSSSSNTAHTAVTCEGDNMALAGANNWLVNGLCFSLLGTRPTLVSSAQNKSANTTMTHAEQQACQVLLDVNKELPGCSMNTALTNQIHSQPRYHPGARYDGFTISCCRHCKGEMYVV